MAHGELEGLKPRTGLVEKECCSMIVEENSWGAVGVDMEPEVAGLDIAVVTVNSVPAQGLVEKKVQSSTNRSSWKMAGKS